MNEGKDSERRRRMRREQTDRGGLGLSHTAGESDYGREDNS